MDPGKLVNMDKDKLHQALTSETPRDALENIAHEYPTLNSMKGFDQENPHHSMDLWNHSLETLNNATMYSDKPEVYMAALYHDIGKPDTKEFNPEKGHYSYHGHDKVGAEKAREELSALGYDQEFIDDVCLLIETHMAPLNYSNQPFGDKGVRRLIRKTKGNNVDISDLMNLNRADILAHEFSSAEATMAGHYLLQEHLNRIGEIT